MKESVDVAEVRYAVLEVPRTEGGSECLVVAYPNEDCLYDVIAASHIVECGFSSREAAVASTKARVARATKQNYVPKATVAKRAGLYVHELHWRERRSDADAVLPSIRRFFVAFYNDAVAAGILMFSSRNIISSAIRTFLAVSL